MTRRDQLRAAPWRFNFFGLMREFERSNPGKPRIGANVVTGEEYVEVGQDPFLEFPGSNVTEYKENEGRADRLRVRFMGYFGPQGALPLNTTAEVLDWKARRNDAFVKFADIFATRFFALFYRAWSVARRITQYDRPGDDRFQTYVGASAGLPVRTADNPPDSLPDVVRLDLAGLLAGRVRSPRRLRQILEAALGVRVEVEEYVPVWVDYEPDDQSQLGASGSSLGVDLRLGARMLSVNDKIRINIRTESLDAYKSFLPGGPGFRRLVDLTTGYLGPTIDVEVSPSMPSSMLPSVRVGVAGTIGHTSWVAPPKPPADAPVSYVQSAVFLAADIDDDEQTDAA